MKQNNLIVGIIIGVILTAFIYQVYTISSFQLGLISHRRVISDLEQTIEEIEQLLTQDQDEAQPITPEPITMPTTEDDDLFSEED